MLAGKHKNIYSHLTAKERDKISFPARVIRDKNLLIGKILDYGCGKGTDVSILNKEGFNILGFDPYYSRELTVQKYDTILCLYVLNVLDIVEQSSVIIKISQLLRQGGKAYFAVRRDLKKEGFRIHKIHKKPTFQCNVKLNFKSIFKNDYCEIYEFQHYNVLQKKNNDCIFCNPSAEREMIAESVLAYAIYDKYPVSKGHALIIPKLHISDYFELDFKIQSSIWFLLNYVKEVINTDYNPDGFNIGVNIGESAGQTIDHVHIHIMPRYSGDIKDPTGGVRGVIPNKKTY